MSADDRATGEFEVDESWVRYEVVEPHIAQITINRPDRRNAILSPDMHVLFKAHLDRAEADDEVKVVILAAEGKDFSAGDDVRRLPVEQAGLKKGGKLPQTARMGNARRLHRHLTNWLEFPKTVIAACQGATLGAGMNLALAADILVVSDDMYLARPQARIGFAGFSTAMPLVLLKLGPNRGYEAMITGRKVRAAELKEWGVAASVVPADRLRDEALRYARAIAHHSSDGLMVGKHALITFWNAVGMAQFGDWVPMGHSVFSNLVWRDDEFNFMKERSVRGGREALAELERRYREWGFE
ncbi:enoyl-CoA hydratase/isomerase family protein [Mycolicibacterium thermoresistibile]|uniref:Enoyl-CoA hydratase/isomerase n=2 Tax=Mycolicibacterium thermoresistibile TaxID=1797 RepID=G7CFW0_MYCT3|nr:enoyl-CoA hydratase/isomerase family protein [Mycolicibacterium thermoresistibile]EHI13389.1 enoyl-CoA hydratase/isomerase [Mycolicibacterium thermoresistibile ATCC 19527]MCV7189181.1 enoyl-CoA hydratase/isomerase family protein [Mycolicibacterium thermoresistibile]GAT14629.1 enoyl-CoA hydratase/carnithine racemase [Mycolicibacterium thermoresistibile]SNW19856.1 enoyl-CoA hydratase/carnithine racemase [Mycolicibacterium thermoresistibile]